MKKVKYRKLSSFLSFLLLALALTCSTTIFAQDEAAAEDSGDAAASEAAPAEDSSNGDVAAGEDLFKANCAACHKLDRNSIGPPLRNVVEKHDREWLYSWIKDSQAMIRDGDPAAVKLFEDHNNAVMTSFPQLSNGDIDNILAYTSQPKAEPKAPATADAQAGGGSSSGGGVSNNIILGALALVFLLLVVMLFLVTNTLQRIATANGVEYPEKEPRTPIWKAFVQNQFLVLITSVFLILAAGYFAYGYMMQVGVDEGYAPVQPIHYSHKIHAGDNQIDCNYCHSSARRSKTSGIPSLNVCMNCHKNIAEVAPETATDEYSKEFYDGEIAKLYNAAGWSVDEQAYTGEAKPVKWVRIHNLPDFAYFNHSQHVTVAGVACQECHGPVEEYEIMKQHAPLTMGWCISCHRETNVKMEGNEYYDKIHEQLAQKYGVEKVTAAQMGGIECGKCHY